MTETTADMDVKPEEQPVKETFDDGIVRPGALAAKLKACRERAEIDQDQAAVQMRLSPAMIKALESENFSELPDPPYVRGYLRSYARLDESDPQDLIRTYELLRGADPDSFATPPPIPLNRVAKPGISPTTLKLFGLVGLVLLLGVLSMIPAVSQWTRDTWSSFSAQTAEKHPATAATSATTNAVAGDIARNNLNTPATGSVTTPVAATAAQPAATVPATPALASSTQDSATGQAAPSVALQPATPPAAGAAGATEETPSPDTELTATDGTQPQAATPAATDPALPATASLLAPGIPASPIADTATGTTPAVVTPATLDTAAATIAATTTPATVTPPTGAALPVATTDPAALTATTATDPATTGAPDPAQPLDVTTATPLTQPIDGEVVVRMEFTQEVWMQVKDSNKKLIFETLNSPNTWKQFKTRTPLTFKIGNAPGVRIFLNGQLYDHTPYTRGSVARFTVN